MNNRRTLSLAFSFVLCLITAVALLTAAANPSRAQGSILYVAPDGYCGRF